MKRSTSSAWAWGWGCALAVASSFACARPSSSPSSGPTPAPEAAEAYYPLAPGWRWAYQIDKGGDTILATYAVLERLSHTVIVQAGDDRIAYELLPQGIARREGAIIGDFVLKTPVQPGAAWPVQGGQARVVKVGATIESPGGTFPGCVVVEEHREDPQTIVRTAFAPGVGPVTIEVQVYDAALGRFETELRATLRGFTRPGEDPLGPPPPSGGKAGRP